MPQLVAQAADPPSYRLRFQPDQTTQVMLRQYRNAAGAGASDLTRSGFRVDVKQPGVIGIIELSAPECKRVADDVEPEPQLKGAVRVRGIVGGWIGRRDRLDDGIVQDKRRAAQLVAIPLLEIQKGRHDSD